jgi:transmembrane sensor
LNRQINEEAARWFVEFRSGDIDEAGRRDFDAWMRTSPEHLRAFIEIAALWGHSGALDTESRFPLGELIARAREATNVISMSHTPRPKRSAANRRIWLAAASVLVVVAGSLLTWSLMRERQTYSTEVGEQRSLRLSDGSTLALNSGSRARIVFGGSTRTVDLLEGEALFHVAQDAARPFIVRAEGAVVRAVGTQFDVDKRSRGTVVTVLEGRVVVLTTGAPADRGPMQAQWSADRAVPLSAGEQLDTAAKSSQPAPANVSSAIAWMQGKVILQSATLEEVAERFNRYSLRRLLAEDHGLAPFRLSGVFSTDPDFLIRYLRERPDIQVHESATQIRIIRTRVRSLSE